MKGFASGLMLLTVLLTGVISTEAAASQWDAAVIPVTVIAEGSGAGREETVTVELSGETEGCPMPEGCKGRTYRMQVKCGAAVSIHIPCETLGVFDYTLRQLPGDSAHCSYDAAVYRLRIFSTLEEDGSRRVSAVIYGQEQTKEPAVLFRNVYAGPVEVVLSAWKTLDGRTPADGRFSFRLLDESGSVVFETDNDGRQVIFPPLTFSEEGVYRYYLKEIAGEETGIQYDRTVYTVTIEVTLDRDYQARVTWERNGKPYTGTPLFANRTDTENPRTGDPVCSQAGILALSGSALALLIKRRRT